ncbi:MAG TPA: hypothetical protein VFK86_11255 [Bauldia sp.]|nr:hypothetical protein [Bauldia sp.]
MAETGEGTFIRLVRFLALGVPTLSRVIAIALVVAAVGVAFLEFGDYDETSRADLALLFAILALVSIGIGFLVPWLVRRFLPRR